MNHTGNLFQEEAGEGVGTFHTREPAEPSIGTLQIIEFVKCLPVKLFNILRVRKFLQPFYPFCFVNGVPAPRRLLQEYLCNGLVFQ